MRTIRTKVYKFEELNEEAKQVAIERVRQDYYEYNDFASWAVDDCALFEPIQTELDLIDFKGNDFIISNNRKKIYFDTDRSSFLDCAEALKVEHCDYFYKWLGIIDEFLLQKINFEIYTPNYINADTTIEFTCDEDFDCFTNEEETVLAFSKLKFDNHIQSVLKRIESEINYRFTDEAIIEDILANEYEFLSNGKQF
jgi:hypothetical protein